MFLKFISKVCYVLLLGGIKFTPAGYPSYGISAPFIRNLAVDEERMRHVGDFFLFLY